MSLSPRNAKSPGRYRTSLHRSAQDPVVDDGGTITEAVSTQVWSGDAAVHVSIVNWVKGDAPGKKRLFRQVGDRLDSPFVVAEVDEIISALEDRVDVKGAKKLEANRKPKRCFQGQTHGHEGFLLGPSEAAALVGSDPSSAPVVHPYMTFDDMLTTSPPRPKRYAIDLSRCGDVFVASSHKVAFSTVQDLVLDDRTEKRDAEAKKNEAALKANANARVNWHHRNFHRTWWQFSYSRREMIGAIGVLPRYIVCGRVTKRPIFDFVSPSVHPNDALTVFPLSDDYSFGVLQSDVHWHWFTARCSTLKGDPRYTSTTVFDSFPWPQAPTSGQIGTVAEAAVALRALRRKVMTESGLTLRELYQMVDELPGANPLRDAHARLDAAVRATYGMSVSEDPLAFLLDLNLTLTAAEEEGRPVVGPGLPLSVQDASRLVTDDCIDPAPLHRVATAAP